MGLFSDLVAQFKKKPEVTATPVATPVKVPTSQLFSAAAQNQSTMPSYKPTTLQSTVPKTTQMSSMPSVKPTIPTPSPVSTQQRSVVSQPTQVPQTKKIQGSGLTDQYVQTASNYKPSIGSSQKQVTPPATTPPATTASTGGSAAMNMLDWFKKSSQLNDTTAQHQIDAQKAATEEYIQQLKDSYGRARQDLIDQIPYLQGASDRAKAELLAAADDIRKSGELEKQQTTANYDEANLTTAKTKKETDAARQRMFAGLGTIDSTGSMGFTGQQTNSDEEFLRQQNNRETEKARALTAIDAKVATAERTAKLEVDKEVANFQEALRKINSQANATDLDKEAQIRAAYTDLTGKVQAINDNLATTKQNTELQKLQYLAELEKTNAAQGADLSPEFVATGVPKTIADFIYKTKNPAGFDTKVGAANTAGKNSGKVLQAVNNVLNGDTGAITGLIKTDWIPGTAGAQTKNDYETLKSMLSLEGRQQLKGSGAISDFEAQMLERASNMGLGQNLSNDQFRAKLQQLKQELEAGQAGATGTPGNEMVVRVKSTGQTGTIPMNEFDPNIYEKV